MTSTNLIVGREREQAQLRQVLDAALAGHGRLVLISGEAGIGKTTLVDDLVDYADERGCLVLSGGCYDLTTTPPYGPWIEVQRGYQQVGEQPAIPAWFNDPEELEAIGSQTALFERACHFYTDLSESQPLVIVLEDLHWADVASLEALRYLARALSQAAIILVVAYRDDELTQRHELYQLLPLLVRESHAQRIHLNRFNDDAVQALVRHRYDLGETEVARLVAHVAERSEGNPLFASEILQGLEDEQILQPSVEGWLLGDLEHVHLPALLRQVIDARFSRLSAETRAALQIAAVIGQTVPLDLWQAGGGLDQQRLDGVIAEALDGRILGEPGTRGAFQFRHALLREALYESLILNRRRSCHRQVGEALIATPNPDPDAVAHQFKEAGDERAVEWLVKAGDRAQRSYAWASAAERFETAVQMLEGIEERASERGWLLFRLAMAIRWIDPGRGVSYHEEAMRLGEQSGDRFLAGVARAYRGLLTCFTGQVRQGLSELKAAVAALDELAPDQSKNPAGNVNPAMGSLSLWLGIVGRYHECVELGEHFLPEFEGFESRLAAQGPVYIWEQPFGWAATQLGSTCMAMHKAYAMLGNPDRADPLIARSVANYKAVNHHGMVALAAMDTLQFATLPYHADDLPRREHWASEAMAAQARSRGAMRDATSARAHRLPLLVIEGAWDDVNELATLFLETNANVAVHVVGMAALGTVARHQGKPEIAWRHVHDALPLGPATEPGERDFLNSTVLQRLAGDLALDSGGLETAREWAEAHDRWLDWSGVTLGRSENQLLWARYYQLSGDLDQAHQLAGRALEHASGPRQPLALIAAHRFLGELEINARNHDAAAEHLRASLDLAVKCMAPFEQAQTLLIQAELAANTGRHEDVRRLLRDARAICEPLEARPTLERLDDLERRLRRKTTTYPAGLSAREAEVLGLVVAGLSNPEIGERLYISPRTVSQHLRSVFNKLNVNSRTAAVTRWIELTRD